MSKVNRRKEIKEKEALQLKFQLALSQNSKTVLSWLPALQNRPNDPLAADHLVFLDLPIVASGTGLSDLETAEQSKTVGDFLQSEGTPKNVKPENTRDIRNGSKAMAALMNRMRSNSRQAAREYGADKVHKHRLKLLQEANKSQKTQKRVKQEEADDSDEEQLKQAQIGAKKYGRLDVGKGKKRPF